MDKNELIEQNMKLVYKVINDCYPTYRFNEDIEQEGMVGLCKAANTFDESKGTFSTYAYWCIKNEITGYIRSQLKHNGVLSLDYEVVLDDSTISPLIEIIEGESDVDISVVDFETFCTTKLNDDERKLIQLLSQYNTVEVAKMLNVSRTLISTRRNNIKKKWRRYIGKGFNKVSR